MYVDFSTIFHRSSKDLSDKGTVHIPDDSSSWPAEWKKIYYKSYPRLPKIPLTKEALQVNYADLVQHRRSGRNYEGKPVEKTALSALLQYSCGIADVASGFRMHPSGGARFPIEVYPIIFRGSADVPAGLYHYNVKDHALDILWQRPFSSPGISELFSYEWIQNASCALVLTATFWRSQMKYGERGYRYILLEAGHIGENIYLAAEAAGFTCCAMGGMWDENIEKLLDIDGITESVVHSLILDVK